jgi:hypothetical protein
MKSSRVILGAGVVLVAACSSATSVDAELQEYCDKAAACAGNATAEQVAECKKLALGHDAELKAECVAVYARAYDCLFAQYTCTNKTLTVDKAKSEEICKTQLEEAAKCQAPPSAPAPTPPDVEPETLNARLGAEGQSANPAATRADLVRPLATMINAVRSKR